MQVHKVPKTRDNTGRTQNLTEVSSDWAPRSGTRHIEHKIHKIWSFVTAGRALTNVSLDLHLERMGSVPSIYVWTRICKDGSSVVDLFCIRDECAKETKRSAPTVNSRRHSKKNKN